MTHPVIAPQGQALCLPVSMNKINQYKSGGQA